MQAIFWYFSRSLRPGLALETESAPVVFVALLALGLRQAQVLRDQSVMSSNRT